MFHLKPNIWTFLSTSFSPSSSRHELSGGSISTTFTCFRSSWMISFSCSWSLSQSTKNSNSELRLLDFLDSIWTRLTWFSCKKQFEKADFRLSTSDFVCCWISHLLIDAFDTKMTTEFRHFKWVRYICQYILLGRVWAPSQVLPLHSWGKR